MKKPVPFLKSGRKSKRAPAKTGAKLEEGGSNLRSTPKSTFGIYEPRKNRVHKFVEILVVFEPKTRENKGKHYRNRTFCIRHL